MKNSRFFFFTVLLLIGSISLFSQNQPLPGQRDWWYTLERGKLMFRQGDYGNALLVFEDARRQRRLAYERMERDLIDLLSINEVRRLRDSLDWIEKYIQEKRYAGASEALEELYFRIPRDTFNNSAAAALTALQTLKDYPEAELWIGETYLAEGELNLALTQFQKALALHPLFENPGFKAELTYKIAAIRRARQEYKEMERVLLSIISTDNLWNGAGSNETPSDAEKQDVFAKQAMLRTLENSGINRFITMYRYGNTESEKAHRLLGYHYYSSGRHAPALGHLMFAFMIQNTVIIDEIKRGQYDYTFTSLDALMAEIGGRPLLLEYAEKNDYYKTAYYLAASLYGNGKTSSARDIWRTLSAQSKAGEWQVRAAAQYRSPYVEKIIEMP
jgi:tetratricopeptide (TPR) repeat protein